jgi:hypothetical protein
VLATSFPRLASFALNSAASVKEVLEAEDLDAIFSFLSPKKPSRNLGSYKRACQTLSSILIPEINGNLIGVKTTQSRNFITLSMTLFRLIQSSNQFGNQSAHQE